MVRASIIVYAGLIAGVLDIAAAMTFSVLSTGRSPIVLLQFISSAIFGNRAFSGGLPMAALGLLLHFAIALTWGIVFIVFLVGLPISLVVHTGRQWIPAADEGPHK